MAKIPIYTERQTYSGRGEKAVTLAGEKVRAQNIPDVMDTTLGSAASALKEIGYMMIQAEETDSYNRNLLEIKKGADAINEEAATSWEQKNLTEHMDTFNERWGVLEERVNSGITSNNVKRLLTKQMGVTKLQTQASVRGLAHQRVHDKYLAGSVESKDFFLDRAITAENDAAVNDNIHEAWAVNKGLVLNGAITREQEAIDNIRIAETFSIEYLKRQIDKDPGAYYTQLTSDKPGEIFNALTEEKKDDILTYAKTMRKATYNESKELEKAIEEKYYRDRDNEDLKMLHDYVKKEVLVPARLKEILNEKYVNNREISEEIYADIIVDMLNPQVVVNDPKVLNSLNDSIILLHPNAKEKIKVAYRDKNISRETYVSLLKAVGNKEVVRGASTIRDKLNPMFVDGPTKKDDIKRLRYDVINKFYESILDPKKLEGKTESQYARDLSNTAYKELENKWKIEGPKLGHHTTGEVERTHIKDKVAQGLMTKEDGAKREAEIDKEIKESQYNEERYVLKKYLRSDQTDADKKEYSRSMSNIKKKYAEKYIELNRQLKLTSEDAVDVF